METREDGNLRLVKVGPLGPFANNAYVIADTASKEAVLVDMPAESAKALAVVRDEGYRVKAVLVTHSHGDHWVDYKLVKETLGAPVMAHEAENAAVSGRIDSPLADGGTVSVGPFTVTAIHTPGHTPGSTCFLVKGYLMSGDTLFPGGPGRTHSPADLQQSVESITTRLYALPDAVEVFPGHGDNTTIGESKREFEAFKGRDTSGLSGDVTWAG
jgi:glyoxylase-like metal-dependent hydrolase (beta-lactamase superfamily II)